LLYQYTSNPIYIISSSRHHIVYYYIQFTSHIIYIISSSRHHIVYYIQFPSPHCILIYPVHVTHYIYYIQFTSHIIYIISSSRPPIVYYYIQFPSHIVYIISSPRHTLYILYPVHVTTLYIISSSRLALHIIISSSRRTLYILYPVDVGGYTGVMKEQGNVSSPLSRPLASPSESSRLGGHPPPRMSAPMMLHNSSSSYSARQSPFIGSTDPRYSSIGSGLAYEYHPGTSATDMCLPNTVRQHGRSSTTNKKVKHASGLNLNIFISVKTVRYMTLFRRFSSWVLAEMFYSM